MQTRDSCTGPGGRHTQRVWGGWLNAWHERLEFPPLFQQWHDVQAEHQCATARPRSVTVEGRIGSLSWQRHVCTTWRKSAEFFPLRNHATPVPFSYVAPQSSDYHLATPYWTDTSDCKLAG